MPARVPSLVAVAVTVAVVLGAACTSAEERERQVTGEALARIATDVDRADRSIALPDVARAGLPARTPRARLRVTADWVDLDEAPPAVARWRTDPARFFTSAPAGSLHTLVPAAARRVVTLHAGRISGADKAGGEQGFLVLPLRPALVGLRDRDPAVRERGWGVWAGATVSYRTMIELLYTAGQADLPRFAVAVTERGRAAEIPVELPHLPDRGPATELALTVTVEAAGVRVCGSGGCLAPACDTTVAGSRAMTIARGAAGNDWGRLRRCIVKIKEAFPEENVVIVRGEPTTTWGDIVAAIAAARGERGELFTSVQLAATL